MTILDEPVRGGYADISALGFPGRERLEMFGTRLPLPPYAHLTGIRLVEIGDGETVTAMPASSWLLSPQGRVPLGMIAALADVSFGSALETQLGPGTMYTTSELSLHRLATPEIDADLTARGQVVYSGPDVALLATTIRDGSDRMVAHGMSRISMLPAIEELSVRPDALPIYEAPRWDTPDPWARPPACAAISADVWERMTGLEVVRAQIAGELPAAPLSQLIGLVPTQAERGSATVTMPAHPWLTNHMMSIHGGFIATLADSAMQLAIQTTTDAGDRFAPLDFKVNYLRPVAPDGRDLTAVATVLHRGRSSGIATADIVNASGKRVAYAVGAAMFGPQALLT